MIKLFGRKECLYSFDLFDAITGAVSATNNLGLGIASLIQRKKERDTEQNISNQNIAFQEATNAQNEALTRESWARDDTAYQRAVKDAQKAGLSAFSVAGNPSGNSSPIAMESPQASAPKTSIAQGFADMANTEAVKFGLLKEQAEINNIEADTDAKINADARAKAEHELLLESMGIANKNAQYVTDLENELRKVEANLIRVQTDYTRSQDEREAESHNLSVIKQAIDNDIASAKANYDKTVTYDPKRTNLDAHNKLQEAKAFGSKLGFELEEARLRNESMRLQNAKDNATFSHDVETARINALMKAKEFANMDTKQKQENRQRTLDAIKTGADSVYVVSHGIREWVDIDTAKQLGKLFGYLKMIGKAVE